MQHCPRCGAASPDNALVCQRCGHPFNRGKQQKKQRSFLAGLLLLLGIRRNPQTGSLGCAPVPATISVALVAVIITGVMVGPVLKLIPPFAPSLGLTVSGDIVPGGSLNVHGTNFPAGSPINLTVDGYPSCGTITVGSDGTFDYQASLPTDWKPNNHYIIQAQAIGKDGHVIVQAQQIVTAGVAPTPADGISIGFYRCA